MRRGSGQSENAVGRVPINAGLSKLVKGEAVGVYVLLSGLGLMQGYGFGMGWDVIRLDELDEPGVGVFGGLEAYEQAAAELLFLGRLGGVESAEDAEDLGAVGVSGDLVIGGVV